jgi:pre-mRNA-processing factor SLU7
MGRTQAPSTRNLRLREDTAKYLINLSLDSAKYDPKTRSMVVPADGDPTKILPGDEEGFYSKTAGDAGDFERAQQYAWETQERGGSDKIHIQANPTEALLLRKRKAEEDAAQQEARKKMLTEKYGSQETLGIKSTRPGPGGSLARGPEITSNEQFIEYDIHGRPKTLHSSSQRKEKSIYPEDIFINNHTAVWGSWWKNFTWGYACCHSVLKNSFCTGEAGKEAVKEAEGKARGAGLALAIAGVEHVGEDREEQQEHDSAEHAVEPGGDDGDGRSGTKRKPAHDANGRKPEEEYKDEESRKHAQELRNAGISEAAMEKYRRERIDRADPMAGMLGLSKE